MLLCRQRLFSLVLTVFYSVIGFDCYAKTAVDIAVFYHQKVTEHRALAALHQLIIKRTKVANKALLQGTIPLKRQIVAFEPIPSSCRSFTDLDKLLADNQCSQALMAYAVQFGADYVTVITQWSDFHSCGFAPVGGRVAVVIDSERCNAISKDYLLAHEWGHLDGAAHSIVDKSKAKLSYGVGYICDGKSTIMNMQTHTSKKHLFYSQADGCGKAGIADVVAMIKQRMKQAGAIQNIEPSMQTLAQVNLIAQHKVISEIKGEIPVSLILSKPLAQPVSVQIYTQDISTKNDFKPLMQRVLFDAGRTRIDINIDILDDSEFEDDEEFYVGIRYPQRLAVGNKQMIFTIVSDDGP